MSTKNYTDTLLEDYADEEALAELDSSYVDNEWASDPYNGYKMYDIKSKSLNKVLGQCQGKDEADAINNVLDDETDLTKDLHMVMAMFGNTDIYAVEHLEDDNS